MSVFLFMGDKSTDSMNLINKTQYEETKKAQGAYISKIADTFNVIDSGWTEDTLLILNHNGLRVCRVVEVVIDGLKGSICAWKLMCINDNDCVDTLYTTSAPMFYKDLQDAQSGVMYSWKDNNLSAMTDCVQPSIDAKYVAKFGGTPVEAKAEAKASGWCQYTYDSSAETMTYWTWNGLNAIEGSIMIPTRYVFDGKNWTFGNPTWGIEDIRTWAAKTACETDNKNNVDIEGFVNGEISPETKTKLFS